MEEWKKLFLFYWHFLDTTLDHYKKFSHQEMKFLLMDTSWPQATSFIWGMSQWMARTAIHCLKPCRDHSLSLNFTVSQTFVQNLVHPLFIHLHPLSNELWLLWMDLKFLCCDLEEWDGKNEEKWVWKNHWMECIKDHSHWSDGQTFHAVKFFLTRSDQ